jgi:hypothetical protein
MILNPSADQISCPRCSGKASLKLASLVVCAAAEKPKAIATIGDEAGLFHGRKFIVPSESLENYL